MTEQLDQGLIDRITDILCTVGSVEGLDPEKNFYDAGVSSVSALGLLIELETEFGVSIPDDEFVTARTPRALAFMINRLKQAQ
jgi:acyl carrier protein